MVGNGLVLEPWPPSTNHASLSPGNPDGPVEGSRLPAASQTLRPYEVALTASPGVRNAIEYGIKQEKERGGQAADLLARGCRP